MISLSDNNIIARTGSNTDFKIMVILISTCTKKGCIASLQQSNTQLKMESVFGVM